MLMLLLLMLLLLVMPAAADDSDDDGAISHLLTVADRVVGDKRCEVDGEGC